MDKDKTEEERRIFKDTQDTTEPSFEESPLLTALKLAGKGIATKNEIRTSIGLEVTLPDIHAMLRHSQDVVGTTTFGTKKEEDPYLLKHGEIKKMHKESIKESKFILCWKKVVAFYGSHKNYFTSSNVVLFVLAIVLIVSLIK